MFRRFLVFYNPFGLVLLLSFLVLLNLDLYYKNLNDLAFYIFISFIFFLGSFLINQNMLRSIKYIITGKIIDLDNVFLSKEQILLKKARKQEDNPLFVPCSNNYFYYDNNYK